MENLYHNPNPNAEPGSPPQAKLPTVVLLNSQAEEDVRNLADISNVHGIQHAST
jgi:hypothetical protein